MEKMDKLKNLSIFVRGFPSRDTIISIMENKRKCPHCGRELTYKNKYYYKVAEQESRVCRSCSATEINKRPGLRDSFIAKYATKGKNTGSDNAFFGKHHSDETIERLKIWSKIPTVKKKFFILKSIVIKLLLKF